MKRILLLGAGRSVSSLIKYLCDNAPAENWTIRIGDISVAHLQPLTEAIPCVDIMAFDVQNGRQLSEEVGQADLVLSMLPAAFHIVVARECLKQGKHLITASYATPALKELHAAAEEQNLIFLMESGLDPGIDHMSAMAVIQRIQAAGGRLTSFKSYTGGLVAPESDTNPWRYKFTWNPRNVVLAGQGTAKYIKNGSYKYIPYHQLFRRTEAIYVEGYGDFEGYANRDSLSYRELYGLRGIPTMLRGTLRRPGYCAAWDALVQLGLTDDSYTLEGAERMTYRSFVEAFLPPSTDAKQSVAERISLYINLPADGEVMEKLAWLGLFEDTPVALAAATPAQVLEKLLKEKWALAPGDRDMIVMQHLFEYEIGGEKREASSTLVATGDDEVHTAMAKTVGLPVGILTKLLLQGKIKRSGVLIPLYPELYEPVLEELKQHGIDFVEKERLVQE
ncbi:saccharopine dehydrogenase C-terminal domain-containing protein [Pontibacter russatus]|uniref:saccharopine dehydrogenase C-terminal domain-containing protein n=1 Tax=Pontibacter russatus TaxID=2694929 RepID=UPI00137B5279|nr:saccharopine dehydrogenase C-terminal domain-containing protein [Pontibacter russatus]